MKIYRFGKFLILAVTVFTFLGAGSVRGQSFLDRMNEETSRVVQKQEQKRFLDNENKNRITLTTKPRQVFIEKGSSSVRLRLPEGNPPPTLPSGRNDVMIRPRMIQQRVTGGSRHFTPALAEQIVRIAREEGVDPLLVLEVMRHESGFKPWARSHAGARGLMQFMPGTARRFNMSDPHDPEQAIRGGCQYLRFLLRRFNGRLDLALAGYNAGEARVTQYGGVPPFRETRNYVISISAAYNDAKRLEKTYLAENFGGTLPAELSHYTPEYSISQLPFPAARVKPTRQPSRAKKQTRVTPVSDDHGDWVFRTKHTRK
jgi:hypothetical protein